MNDIIERLRAIVGEENVLVGDDINEEYACDEALTVKPRLPQAVVKPVITQACMHACLCSRTEIVTLSFT